MIETVGDLIRHKAHADAVMLGAVREHEGAAADLEIRQLLLHALVANRFWLLTVLGLPFVAEEESLVPESFDALIRRYRTTHEQELAWLATVSEAELRRDLDVPRIPGGTCSVRHAFMQVCLHSQGHRSQCAKLLRRHGAMPPTTDFVLWQARRPPAPWPEIAPQR